MSEWSLTPHPTQYRSFRRRGDIGSRFLSGRGGVGGFGTFDACSSSDEVILKVVFAAHHVTIVSVDCAITQQTLKKCIEILGQSA